MENNLPMIKKEGIFSKIFNKVRNMFGKKEIDTSENINGIKQVNSNKLAIVDRSKGIALEVDENFKQSLKIALNRTNLQLTNGQVELTNLPLEIQNEFLEKLISVSADNMCMILDDDLLNKNEEKFSQKNKMFDQINFTLNMPRSFERRGEKMPDERKKAMYFEMLNKMFDYMRETIEFLDGELLKQNNETKEQFLEGIEYKPVFVDPNNIISGNNSEKQNQR